VLWNVDLQDLIRGVNPLEKYCKECYYSAFDGDEHVEGGGTEILWKREEEDGETDCESDDETDTTEVL
jgi:hypothetical protein